MEQPYFKGTYWADAQEMDGSWKQVYAPSDAQGAKDTIIAWAKERIAEKPHRVIRIRDYLGGVVWISPNFKRDLIL